MKDLIRAEKRHPFKILGSCESACVFPVIPILFDTKVNNCNLIGLDYFCSPQLSKRLLIGIFSWQCNLALIVSPHFCLDT